MELWKRKGFCTLGSPLTDEISCNREGGKYSLRGELSNRGAEDKAKGNLNRLLMLVSSPQPKMLVHSTTRAGGACVLRLGLWRSGPTDRTGVGCVEIASMWGLLESIMTTAESVHGGSLGYLQASHHCLRVA